MPLLTKAVPAKVLPKAQGDPGTKMGTAEATQAWYVSTQAVPFEFLWEPSGTTDVQTQPPDH